MVGYAYADWRTLYPKFLNDFHQAPFLTVRHGTYGFSKDREFISVTGGNTSQKCKNVDCQRFRIFRILHNHVGVKQPSVFLVRGQIDNVNLVGNLRQRFFPVPTFRLWVYNDRLCAKQHRVVDNHVVGE